MWRLMLLMLIFLAPIYLSAQQLDVFNQERLNINETGMIVLGSWAITNMALSPILASRSSGWRRSFHQMNGYWNGVNLIIAGFGYFNAVNGDPSGLNLSDSFREQHAIEKILLFNTALDVAYIMGGLYLQERGKTASTHQERFKGFGRSIMLQGGFLFAFDVILYLAHHQHGKILYQVAEQVSIAPGLIRIAFRI